MISQDTDPRTVMAALHCPGARQALERCEQACDIDFGAYAIADAGAFTKIATRRRANVAFASLAGR